MVEVVGVLRATFRSMWEDVWTVAVCNLLWLVSVVLIIPGPPASLALFYYGNRLAHGEIADLKDFLQAFRNSWGVGWRWGFINLLFILILIGDIQLTTRLSQSPAAYFARGFYIAGLGFWLLLQLFTIPFLFEQERPDVRMALRNGAVMIVGNPGFSLLLGVLILSILLVGTLLFMLSAAVGGTFLALAGNHAVINRLEANRITALKEK